MTNHELADGWIGRWSPGIGDPSLMGWLTVVLYVLAAWQCYRLVSEYQGVLFPRERMLWWLLVLGLLALGINKQLDLQSALTEIGRMLARQEGWYDRRRELQVLFIAAVVALCGFSAIALGVLARRSPRPTVIALLGCVCLLGFVVIRASSFHHMDRFIGSELLGLRMNWIFEMGGLAIITFGAQGRLRQCRS